MSPHWLLFGGNYFQSCEFTYRRLPQNPGQQGEAAPLLPYGLHGCLEATEWTRKTGGGARRSNHSHCGFNCFLLPDTVSGEHNLYGSILSSSFVIVCHHLSQGQRKGDLCGRLGRHDSAAVSRIHASMAISRVRQVYQTS